MLASTHGITAWNPEDDVRVHRLAAKLGESIDVVIGRVYRAWRWIMDSPRCLLRGVSIELLARRFGSAAEFWEAAAGEGLLRVLRSGVTLPLALVTRDPETRDAAAGEVASEPKRPLTPAERQRRHREKKSRDARHGDRHEPRDAPSDGGRGAVPRAQDLDLQTPNQSESAISKPQDLDLDPEPAVTTSTERHDERTDLREKSIEAMSEEELGAAFESRRFTSDQLIDEYARRKAVREGVIPSDPVNEQEATPDDDATTPEPRVKVPRATLMPGDAERLAGVARHFHKARAKLHADAQRAFQRMRFVGATGGGGIYTAVLLCAAGFVTSDELQRAIEATARKPPPPKGVTDGPTAWFNTCLIRDVDGRRGPGYYAALASEVTRLRILPSTWRGADPSGRYRDERPD